MMLVLRTNDVAYGSDAHGVNDAALRTNDVTLNGELASITASSIIMSAANNIILTSSKHHCEQPRVTSLSLCENITASKREQHHFRSAKTSLRATASNITFALRKHHCEQPRVTSLSLCENITASNREQHHFRFAKIKNHTIPLRIYNHILRASFRSRR